MTKEDAGQILNTFIDCLYTNLTEERYQELKVAIETLSAQKTGKWILKGKGSIVSEYECSECKRVVIDDTEYDVCRDYPYCNCGARMECEEE